MTTYDLTIEFQSNDNDIETMHRFECRDRFDLLLQCAGWFDMLGIDVDDITDYKLVSYSAR
jgi:hypothetical protein